MRLRSEPGSVSPGVADESGPQECQVRMTSPAIRDLEAIPPRYTAAILEFIYGPLAQNPQRIGKPLVNELQGRHSARRGDYRVIYRIHEDENAVSISRIDHRARVCRARG